MKKKNLHLPSAVEVDGGAGGRRRRTTAAAVAVTQAAEDTVERERERGRERTE